MALTTNDVFQAAFDLPNEDRTRLVERLLETLPESNADEVEKAWKEEVQRRLESIKNGTAKLIPGEEVFASLGRKVQQ